MNRRGGRGIFFMHKGFEILRMSRSVMQDQRVAGIASIVVYTVVDRRLG